MTYRGYENNKIDMSLQKFCIPKEVSFQKQLPRIVVKYFKSHPDKLHEPAAVLIVDAIREAYPCKINLNSDQGTKQNEQIKGKNDGTRIIK
jgi:hypothetical protein